MKVKIEYELAVPMVRPLRSLKTVKKKPQEKMFILHLALDSVFTG